MRTLTAILILSFMMAATACSDRKGKVDAPATTPAPDSTAVATKATDSAPPKAEQSTGEIWQGRSDGFAITWSGDDLVARRGSANFSLLKMLRKEWEKEAEEDGGEDSLAGAPVHKGCVTEDTIKLLSVVGPIVSMERGEYRNCEMTAHPSVTTWYTAIDLRNPEKPLKLTDLFEEKDILRALLDDALVKKTLQEAKVTDSPKTLKELIEKLKEAPAECHYSFSDDLLTRFAFHHVEGGQVAVRLGLSHGAEPCRGVLTQVGILLPIPRSLENPLKQAESRKEGFMMQDQKKVSGGRATFMQVR